METLSQAAVKPIQSFEFFAVNSDFCSRLSAFGFPVPPGRVSALGEPFFVELASPARYD